MSLVCFLGRGLALAFVTVVGVVAAVRTVVVTVDRHEIPPTSTHCERLRAMGTIGDRQA